MSFLILETDDRPVQTLPAKSSASCYVPLSSSGIKMDTRLINASWSSSSDSALFQMHYVNLFVQKHNHLVPAFIPDKLRDTDQDTHNVFTQVRHHRLSINA